MASVTTLWSTTTDFSAAVTNYPGVYDSTAGVTITDMYGTNGTYSNSNTGASYTQSSDTIAIADTSGITTDQYVYVVWGAGSTGGVNGYFKVDNVDTDNSITLGAALNTAGATKSSTDATVDYYVGGIGDASDGAKLQTKLDNIGPDCGATSGDTANNLTILYHSTVDIVFTSTLDIDNISGSTTTRVRITATDSSFVSNSNTVEINTATALTGLIEYAATSDFVTFKKFIFNAKDGASGANYTIYNNVDGSDNHVFIDCEIKNAVLSNIAVKGVQPWRFYNCDTHSATQHGIATLTGNRGIIHYFGGKIRDNTLDGGNLNVSVCLFGYVIIEGNGDSGLETTSTSSRELSVFGCTVEGNGGSGVKFFNSTTYREHLLWNNSFTGNGAYGVEFQHGVPEVCDYLGHNHAYNNTSGPSDVATTDAAWLVLGDGNNIVGDPDFDANYVPSSTSPLLDAGISGDNDTIGALCADAGSGTGLGISQGLHTITDGIVA